MSIKVPAVRLRLPACLAPVFLLLPAALFAKVTVGAWTVETGRVFAAGDYSGKEGVLVTASDVTVTGHKGKTVFAYARIVRGAKPPFCERQIMYTIDGDRFHLPQLQFRFPNAEILEVYGAGRQSLRVEFMFYTLSGSLPKVLDDFFMVRPLALDLREDMARAEPDARLAQSRDYIEEKAKIDAVYARLKESSARTGLAVYVRGSSLSPSAAQEYTAADPEAGEEADVALGVDKLVAFLQTLPDDFIKSTRLKGVAFTGKITFHGFQVGGGMDGFGRIVLLPAAATRLDPTGTLLLHTFCHEFFHYLEKVYYLDIDAAHWQALNPPGFSYKAGGGLDDVSHPRADVMDEHSSRGFVTRYAASDHYQDKAETFAYLMVSDLRRKAIAWAKTDPYLKAKLDYMKTVLQKIHPGLNGKWFALP